MLRTVKKILSLGLVLRLLAVFAGIFCCSDIYATTIGTIQTNLTAGLSSVTMAMEDIALVAGVGFIFASFFKFHQHKMNPTQVPLSQGVTLMVVGAGLAVFPHLLTTATQGVFATGIEKLGGTGITKIIGS